MNGAHFHLIVNHVSLFALAFGILILIATFKWSARELLFTALTLFVVGGVFAVVAHQSGEAAEHVLKAALPEVEKAFIHEHEEAAKFAMIAGLITGVGALIVGWVALKAPARLRVARIVLLVVALWASSVFVRTIYLGGLIRHTEIRGQ